MSAAQAALVEAQRRVEELRERNRPKVLDEVRKKIHAYGFTAEELGLARVRQVPAPKTSAASKVPDVSKVADRRSFVRPKYIGPAGETWSGRGRNPAWLTAQIDMGRPKEDFLAPPETVN